MNETPYFFENESQQLFAVEHKPEEESKNIAWVFCHPFAEEKLWAHRVYVNLARKLASMGYPVLRFDYRGYGDSEGEFEEFTVEDQLSDIQAAVQQINDRYPGLDSIGLLGLRYGASLAAMVAEQNDNISHLVLWSPINDLDQYMQEVLRANLTTQMVMHGKVVTNRDELTQQILDGGTVNVDGYELTREFFTSATKINLLDSEKKFNGRCLIVQIGRPNQGLKKGFENLASKYSKADLDQVVEEQFWKEIKNFIQQSDSLTESLIHWIDGVQSE